VIHGMDDEQDMRRYGGLARLLPVTFVTFILAYLAIIGVPPFSGFYTKDGIIEAAWDRGGTAGPILTACAILGVGITAFYMTRMVLMTFSGKSRRPENTHPHESPAVMTVPMILLAVGSVGAGAFLILGQRFENFLGPVTGVPPTAHGVWSVAGGISLVLIVAGAALAWNMYGRVPVPATAPRGSFPVVAGRKDLYGDALNESLIMRPGQWLTRLSVYFDNRGVDGLVNSLAALVGGTSGRLRRVQTGFVRSYAMLMFLGAFVVITLLLVVRL
jgi:NADH-quinone oxidoreductase subunit L